MTEVKDLKKYTLKLKTLSPVSLSPRESYCYYKDIDYDDEVSDANIIYPFYHYGEYERFDSGAQYYIPGSALKGSLEAPLPEQEKKEMKLYVDDIEVGYENLFLTTPNKLQFIRSLDDFNVNKKPTFTKFFPNVEVQVLKANHTFEATVYVKDKETLENLQKKVFELTQEKLEFAKKIICQLIKKIDIRIGKEEVDSDQYQQWLASRKELEKFRDKLLQYENKNIIFLGGYKGEAFSKSSMTPEEISNYQGTFYIDKTKTTGLPFGLVEVLSIEEMS